jgi:hypothetical protein
MRRSAWVFCFVLFILGAAVRSGSAQAVESADARQLQITAGGMVSGFQPDEGETDLIGLGTYVDVQLYALVPGGRRSPLAPLESVLRRTPG